MEARKNSTDTVSVLLCHRHVPMAMSCLGSLLRLCSEPLRLRIHDDGTLTEEDLENLGHQLSQTQFVSRKEANERLLDEFGRYRRLLELRRTDPFIMKVLDGVAYRDGPIYAYIDSDVLFFRPFHNPFHLSDSEVKAVFMRDVEHSYSFRSWQKLLARNVQLAGKINAGIIVIRAEAVDFDLMEWHVSQSLHQGIPSMLEQTFWAMLGTKLGCRVFDPEQLRVMQEGEHSRELVAGHFTAPTRHLLPEFVRRSGLASLEAEPVRLGTISPGRCTAWDLFQYEMRRIIRKRVKPKIRFPF